MTASLLTLALFILCVLPVPGPRNLPPVAVDDEVMVFGYTDYLEIPVFANDYDPEGKPIDVIGLETVDRGKAVLLEGDAVGVYPDWSLVRDDSTKPVLIASGTYVISDGELSSTGHWFVWH
ncbi:MAG: hypothetical protein R2844_16260 [Caldilineales bacterium]